MDVHFYSSYQCAIIKSVFVNFILYPETYEFVAFPCKKHIARKLVSMLKLTYILSLSLVCLRLLKQYLNYNGHKKRRRGRILKKEKKKFQPKKKPWFDKQQRTRNYIINVELPSQSTYRKIYCDIQWLSGELQARPRLSKELLLHVQFDMGSRSFNVHLSLLRGRNGRTLHWSNSRVDAGNH